MLEQLGPLFSQGWTVLDEVSTVGGAIAAIGSLIAWRKTSQLIKLEREARRTRETPISIILRKCGSDSPEFELELPYRPRRDQLTRPELVGVIGIYIGEPRFDPFGIVKCLESGEFSRVVSGEGSTELVDVIHIELSPNEFDCVRKRINSGISSQAKLPANTTADAACVGVGGAA